MSWVQNLTTKDILTNGKHDYFSISKTISVRRQHQCTHGLDWGSSRGTMDKATHSIELRSISMIHEEITSLHSVLFCTNTYERGQYECPHMPSWTVSNGEIEFIFKGNFKATTFFPLSSNEIMNQQTASSLFKYCAASHFTTGLTLAEPLMHCRFGMHSSLLKP